MLAYYHCLQHIPKQSKIALGNVIGAKDIIDLTEHEYYPEIDSSSLVSAEVDGEITPEEDVTEIDEFIDKLAGCDPLARDGICVVHIPYGDPIQAGPGERDTVWNISHGLGVRFVLVDFVDEEAMRRVSDEEILAVTYIDENNLQVRFKDIKYG